MGHVQIALGGIFGSFSLVAAGIHNELDGPVHGLRGKAAHESNLKEKLRYRIRAGCLMIAGATGIFLLEKVVPVDASTVIVPITFGAETVVNGYNTVNHIRSHSKTQDTRFGLGHNGLDTLASFMALAFTSHAVASGSTSEFAEKVVGYGHVVGMTGLGALSIFGALRSYRIEQPNPVNGEGAEDHS